MNLLYIIATGILSVLYVWSFYNIPILVAGVKHIRDGYRKDREILALNEKLPSISIIVPVKDEEKLVGRLVEALLRLHYPQDKYEIVIVEDGSLDNTARICREYCRRYPGRVRLVCRRVSNGKPSALNYGLEHARGDIVAVFDADSVPDPDALSRVVKHFEDSSVAAVQGQNSSINADQNVLTKLVSYEEAVAFQTYLQGRDALNLFVPLTGSCFFVRKDLIEKVGGWDSESLSEDLEVSIKLVLGGYKIKYASDVRCLKETSAKVNQLISQRMRWFRGSMEVGLKYGKLVTKLNRKNVDVEFTLAGPYIFPLCFAGFIIAMYGFFVPTQAEPLSRVLSNLALLLTVIHLLIAGTTLIYVTNFRKLTVLPWLSFIYAYWFVEACIATYALILIALGRPRKWTKTTKTGEVGSYALSNIS